jgi:ethanolamine utilization protein EutA (predicted chaperonin)
MAKQTATITVDATEIEKALDKGIKNLKKAAKSIEKEELKAIHKELAGINDSLKLMAHIQVTQFLIENEDLLTDEQRELIKAAMTKAAEEGDE